VGAVVTTPEKDEEQHGIQHPASAVCKCGRGLWECPEAAAMYAKPTPENDEVGRCGEQAPRFFADQHTTFCCLPHGHPGWHKGDDGAEWTESDQEADHA
jgi:hypothetical protein